MTFEEFLNLPEDERIHFTIEHLGIKLSLWQKLEIKFINKWWSHMKRLYPQTRAIDLWESLCKGRF